METAFARDVSPALQAAALLGLFVCVASLQAVSGQPADCRCDCCKDDLCPTLTMHKFAAGGPEACNAQRCASNFFQCPDGGSHNEAAEVYATYFDCSCECGAPGEYVLKQFFAGSTAACTEAACASRFASCPDPGSHNDELDVKVTYTGVDDSGADDSCECSCCKGDMCAEGRTKHTFFASFPSQCTKASCSSNFFQCPDVGTHNDDGEVFATFYDCKCACCDANSCPDYVSNVFIAGSPDMCTPAQCSARFSFCPDLGSHNDGSDVQAFFNENVAMPSQAAPSPAGLATGGIIGIVVALAVAAAVAIGFFTYFVVKKRTGHVWVKEDEFKRMLDLASSGPEADSNPKEVAMNDEAQTRC